MAVIRDGKNHPHSSTGSPHRDVGNQRDGATKWLAEEDVWKVCSSLGMSLTKHESTVSPWDNMESARRYMVPLRSLSPETLLMRNMTPAIWREEKGVGHKGNIKEWCPYIFFPARVKYPQAIWGQQ